MKQPLVSLRAIALLVLVALLAAACGGNDNSASTTTTTAPVEASAAEDTTDDAEMTETVDEQDSAADASDSDSQTTDATEAENQSTTDATAEEDGDQDAEASGDAEEDHGQVPLGRLLVADAAEAHLSVLDLTTGDLDVGAFEIAAPNAYMHASPTGRYAIALARGPQDGDDRIHVFDGGIFAVPHGDHYHLTQQPVARHELEIVEEWPVHHVNSHGWSAIFNDTNGHVVLINEEDLASSDGNYEPIVLEAGPQHGTAFVISEDHVIHSVNPPDCPQFIPGTWGCLPSGVEVRTFDGEVVYDAANKGCTSLHGESENAHGAVFGCRNGVLFLQSDNGQYEHEIIPYPEETGGNLSMGRYYGHSKSDNFFAPATVFEGDAILLGGVWMVDVLNAEMREVFPEPSASAAFSSDGDVFYMLAADGILRAFDADQGEQVGNMQLVDPFEMAYGTPTPAIIVVGEIMYVADPNSGRVLGVHLEHMEIEEEWELGGAPSSLAFVGVTDE